MNDFLLAFCVAITAITPQKEKKKKKEENEKKKRRRIGKKKLKIGK